MKTLEEYIYNLMDERPSDYMVYHDKAHTKQVLSAAIGIAEKEGVKEEDIHLLKAAALLHDSGYIFTTEEHEEKSCEIARQILPEYNYTVTQIAAICKMIMATKVPQKPHNHLSKILCDADLSYIGTDSYFN